MEGVCASCPPTDQHSYSGVLLSTAVVLWTALVFSKHRWHLTISSWELSLTLFGFEYCCASSKGLACCLIGRTFPSIFFPLFVTSQIKHYTRWGAQASSWDCWCYWSLVSEMRMGGCFIFLDPSLSVGVLCTCEICGVFPLEGACGE